MSAAEWVPRKEAAAVSGYHIKTINKLTASGRVAYRMGPVPRSRKQQQYVHVPSLLAYKQQADAWRQGGFAVPASMEPSKTKLGTALRAWRVERNWSQEYVAKAIHSKKSSVSQWECGDRVPSVMNAVLLCELYDLDHQTRWAVIEAIAWRQKQ
jgi:DNA-binding XRE family transcriptional regulator